MTTPIAEGAGATIGKEGVASTAGKWSTASNVVSTIGTVSQYSPTSGIIGFIQARKNRKMAQNQFDRVFNENLRQWGVEWALQEWATRKNVSLQEAQLQYQKTMGRKAFELQSKQVGSQLESEALARQVTEQDLWWKREDREKQQRMAKAYSRGLVMGILGKGQA